MKMKNNVRTQIRLLYGLSHVLKEDIENLRFDANVGDTYRIRLSVNSVADTLDKINDLVAEIEYSIYLENSKGSH